ncbi:hypothetical protein [Hyperthermus butylicus]|uniref:Uncharacterized protein n=1 Tax=Hyperthermus butylicus (strain DSM 5456 / JCM 9403 / PLM1-5) TaxID=415426 RepID=A2BMG3_HYPBU|nr:hypothetical protein [Hyperthermus butylicus]ABM81174.1 hypothetical protein Hbut_1345 [Hyperthermus butylicus DSM 5456]
MSTVTLSIRIRRELREKMKQFSHVDWRAEIEKFIEERIREEELRQLLDRIDRVLDTVEQGGEPAWKTIREYREIGR